MNKTAVATINVDGFEERGTIWITEDVEYTISVELPNGTIENPEIAPQRSRENALTAIAQSWGISDWDLQFIDAM